MNSMLEKRHTRISTDSTVLSDISSYHPFTQQIDVVFPSQCRELENALSALTTCFARGRVDLANMFTAGSKYAYPYATSPERTQDTSSTTWPQHRSDLVAVSLNHGYDAQSDDVWCIDTRGVLTMCVCKETYEKLGLLGQKMPFKNRSGERYVISSPLHKDAESVSVRRRRRSALESWDTGFTRNIAVATSIESYSSSQRLSKGIWEVVYCLMAQDANNETDCLDRWASEVPIDDPIIVRVTCEKVYLENIWIPDLTALCSCPVPTQEEELEDWKNDISVLFEWVGMAGLNAQRLEVNDRVDPFVAIYDPPAASRVGNATHLRWKGFLPPSFVQSVIDTSIIFLQSPQSSPNAFVAITMQGVTDSPVVYLSPRYTKSGSTATASNSPAHLPSEDGEDTWSLILIPPKGGNINIKSILYESVGQWDARWG